MPPDEIETRRIVGACFPQVNWLKLRRQILSFERGAVPVMGGKRVEKREIGGRKAIDDSTRRRCAERMVRARLAAGHDSITVAVANLKSAGWPITYQQLYNWEQGKRIASMDALAQLIALGHYPRHILFPDGLTPAQEAKIARQANRPDTATATSHSQAP
jgi:hypothetical protein